MRADSPLAALIICGATRADKVMVKGKLLVDKGQLIYLDLAKHAHEHKRVQASMRAK